MALGIGQRIGQLVLAYAAAGLGSGVFDLSFDRAFA